MAETVGFEVLQRDVSVGVSVGASGLTDDDAVAAGSARDIAVAALADKDASFAAAGNIVVVGVGVDSEVAGYSDESGASGRDHEQNRDWDNRQQKHSILDICEHREEWAGRS